MLACARSSVYREAMRDFMAQFIKFAQDHLLRWLEVFGLIGETSDEILKIILQGLNFLQISSCAWEIFAKFSKAPTSCSTGIRP